MTKDTRDIAKGALTNFAGVLFGSLNLIFYIFLSQAYGAEVVGIFVFSRSSVDIISKLGLLGLDRGILVIAAKFHAEGDDEALYRSIGQSLIIGLTATFVVIFLLEAGLIPILGKIYQKTNLILPLRIMGVGMVFWTISSILLFATRALRIMKYQVIVKNGVEPLSIFILAVPFYFLDMGITGLAVAFVFSTAVGALVSVYFFSKEFSLKRVAGVLFAREGRKNLFRFAAPIGIYDTLNLLMQRIDLFILTRFASSSTVGVYSMVQNAAFVFKKVRQSFDPILIPVISASHQLKDKKNLLLQYQNVTRWILILNIAFLGLTFFSARTIMSIFGKDFTVGYLALIVLTAAIMVNTILGVSELFILIDRPIINLMNTIGTIVVAVILNLSLVPYYGMLGASLSVLIAYILMNIVRLIEVQTMYEVHPFTRYHLRAILAAVPSFALVFLFKKDFIGFHGAGADLLSALFFFVLYFLFLMLFGMAKEEKKVVYEILKFIKIK